MPLSFSTDFLAHCAADWVNAKDLLSRLPIVSAQSLRAIRWMGWLFAIGSACFAIGVPLSLVTSLSPVVAAATFFVGSVFFTSAASIQARLGWLEGHSLHDASWTSAAIQWLGTIFFNVTTLRSLIDVAGTEALSNQVVWRPDAIGSILFLVSSVIALSPEVRAHRHGHVRDRTWTIAALNMVGSIFFGISAVGAYVVPDTSELLNSAWANGGTLLGAVCFLLGALLVLPRSTGGR